MAEYEYTGTTDGFGIVREVGGRVLRDDLGRVIPYHDHTPKPARMEIARPEDPSWDLWRCSACQMLWRGGGAGERWAFQQRADDWDRESLVTHG